MKVGDKVRISTSGAVGIITETNPRRVPERNSIISFYTVKHEDGTQQEYGREELRYWEDDSWKEAIRNKLL